MSAIKRFYRAVSVAGEAGGYTVLLDGKAVRTPGRAQLVLHSQPLAEAIAAEWHAQGEHILAHTMPLLRLANTALERVPETREAVRAEALAYARSDLTCHRAEHPQSLVAREAAAWDPLLAWLADRHGARLTAVTGITHAAQPEEAIAALNRALMILDDFALTALSSATALSGSLVIALALIDGHINAAEAFGLASIEEAFQAERWGEDAEARARLDTHRAELSAIARFVALTRA